MLNAPVRKPRPVVILDVLGTERLTDHLVRVHAGGPGFGEFSTNAATDKYVKIHFAKPHLGLVPPYDLAVLRETLPPDDLPVTRTYTVRAVGSDRLSIDFVVHGDGGPDAGIAGPWAAAAQPGDQLVVSGPGGAYAPDPAADVHLLAGDESAIPAIASALEALPEHAVGVAFVETFGPRDELPLAAPAGVEVRWLHRGDVPAGTSSVLVDAVAAWTWPTGRVQVFAHGERESMKALRAVFASHDVPRSDLSLSGYWAYGRTEDRFQAEKREPIGVVL